VPYKYYLVSLTKDILSQVVVANACNSSYSGGRNQEGQYSKPAWANSSRDSVLKISNTNTHILNKQKRADGVTQVIACLLSKCESLSSNPNPSIADEKKTNKKMFSFSHFVLLVTLQRPVGYTW
jgi:hypothetical protein